MLGLAVKFCTLHLEVMFEEFIVYICYAELFYTLTKKVFLVYGHHRIAIDLNWRSNCKF